MSEARSWRGQIADLDRLDPDRVVFGASTHQYRLADPLPQRDVEAIEHRYDIEIPADYRDFVMFDGNGGAGPGYGLWPLGLWTPDRTLEPWDAGNWNDQPSEPFPHTSPWNVPRSLSDNVPADDAPWEQHDAHRRLVDDTNWAPGLSNGAVPIAHVGCAIYLLLIVTGCERGYIWIDDRASDNGIYPATTEQHPDRIRFDDLMNDWLRRGRLRATTGQRTTHLW